MCSSVTFLFLQTLSSRNLSHSNISQFKFRIRTDYFGLVVIKRRKCFRLKKQITNDRSAPLVTGVNLLWIGELVNRRCRIKHCNALVEKLGNWCHFQPSSDTLGIISKMSNSNDNNCWIKIKKNKRFHHSFSGKQWIARVTLNCFESWLLMSYLIFEVALMHLDQEI